VISNIRPDAEAFREIRQRTDHHADRAISPHARTKLFEIAERKKFTEIPMPPNYLGVRNCAEYRKISADF
jgi:hypothetical protein